MTDITVTCKTHLTTHITTHTQTTHGNPAYCPTCAHPITQRAPSYIEAMCRNYVGMHPKLAAKCIEIANQHNDHHPRNSYVYPEDVLKLIHPNIRMVPESSWQHVTCESCASSFSTLDVTLRYCIFCGKATLTSQHITEQTLSRIYSLPVPLIRILFAQWQSNSAFTTFADFMNEPSIAKMTQRVHEGSISCK